MKDLVVKVSEYTNNDGETKRRYQNIGVLMDGDNGQYILLDPSFNPAGALVLQRLMDPQKAGSRVMVSIFDKERKGNQGQQNAPSGGNSGGFDPDSEIPFMRLGKEHSF